VPPRLAQRLVERLVQRLPVLLVHGQAHHPLQQASVLRQMGIVDLGDFMAAVVVVVQRQQTAADQQQQHDPPQRALAQRTHARPSTR